MMRTPGRLFLASLYGVVILAPMGWLVGTGIRDAQLAGVMEDFGRVHVQDLLANSILLALLTTLFAVLLGAPLAFLLNLRRFPGRRLLGLLYFLPLLVPPHIHAIAWARVIGDQGWLTELVAGWGGELDMRASLWAQLGEPGLLQGLLQHLYPGPAWIMACAFFPLVTLSTSAGIRTVDPEGLEAGTLLGGRRTALRGVILPQVAPRILAGAFFVFVLALSTYPVVSLLDTPVLIQKVFLAFSKRSHGAGALMALPLVGVAALAVVLIGVAEGRTPRVASGLRRLEPRQGGLVLSLLALLPLLLATGVPLGSLMRAAGGLSLGAGQVDNYQSAFSRVQPAFVGSLFFSVLGGVVLLLVSYPVGRLVARRGTRSLELLGLGCLAFPAAVVGGSLLSLWSAQVSGGVPRAFWWGLAVLVAAFAALRRRDKPIRNLVRFVGVLALLLLVGLLLGVSGMGDLVYHQEIIMVVMAYMIRFLPFTVRLFRNGFLTLDRDEEAAARLCGHRLPSRLWRVELPRMRGVVAGAAVMAYVLCFTELAAFLLVKPAGWESLQMRIFNMVHYQSIGEVAALCVLSVVLAALPVVIFLLLARRKVQVL